MGPVTLDEFREKLSSQHSERKLAALGQLWETFNLQCVFVDNIGANAFSATAIGELGVGPLREIGGMLSLQLTPFRELTGVGVKERPESSQLTLCVGDKEMHLAWPAPLSAMLEDETFQWIIRLQKVSQAPART
jgi:hypothetical protein